MNVAEQAIRNSIAAAMSAAAGRTVTEVAVLRGQYRVGQGPLAQATVQQASSVFQEQERQAALLTLWAVAIRMGLENETCPTSDTSSTAESAASPTLGNLWMVGCTSGERQPSKP